MYVCIYLVNTILYVCIDHVCIVHTYNTVCMYVSTWFYI